MIGRNHSPTELSRNKLLYASIVVYLKVIKIESLSSLYIREEGFWWLTGTIPRYLVKLVESVARIIWFFLYLGATL